MGDVVVNPDCVSSLTCVGMHSLVPGARDTYIIPFFLPIYSIPQFLNQLSIILPFLCL